MRRNNPAFAVFLCIALACGKPKPQADAVIAPASVAASDQLFEKIIADTQLGHEEIDALKDKAQIRILINAIYARHGYIFRNPKIAAEFEKYPWYKPQRRDVEPYLTDNDRVNIESLSFREDGFYLDELKKTRNPGFQGPLNPWEEFLTGIWQDAPVIASGWSETYQFFPSRIVIWRANQMDCAKRLLLRIGHWKVNNGVLIFEYFAEGRLIGGRHEPAAGSCGSDTDIVGGITQTQLLKSKISGRMRLSEKEYLSDFGHYRTKFGKMNFFKHRDDPDDYE